MYVKESTKNIMFWFCGVLFGAYWSIDLSTIHAIVSIVICSIVLTLIDCFVHTTKKPTKRLIPPTNE